jgi:hypothetical protein
MRFRAGCHPEGCESSYESRWLKVKVALATALALSCLTFSAAKAGKPLPTPAVYVTGNYALTFRSPIASTYCPLGENWIGSDHGTLLFLDPPKTCFDAGYPSNGRGFEPGSTPRIEVYYSYWMGEDERAQPCKRVGRIRFLNRWRTLCGVGRGRSLSFEVSGRYEADSEAIVVLTLTTNHQRVTHGLATFKAMAASLRSCTSSWKDNQGKSGVIGTGPSCPDGKWF